MDQREFEIKKRRIQHGYAIKACDLELEELKEIQALESQLHEYKVETNIDGPITNTVNFRGVQIGTAKDEVVDGDKISQEDKNAFFQTRKAETPMAGPHIDPETPMAGPYEESGEFETYDPEKDSVYAKVSPEFEKVSVDGQVRSEEEKDVDILDVNEMTMLEEILNRLSYVEYIKPLTEKNYELGLTDTNKNSITVECELPDFEPAPDGKLVNVCPYPHVKTNRAELGVTYTREYFKEPKPEVDEVFPDLDNPKFVGEESKYPTHDDFARILKTDSERISVKEVFDYLGEITDFPEDDLKRIQEELGDDYTEDITKVIATYTISNESKFFLNIMEEMSKAVTDGEI